MFAETTIDGTMTNPVPDHLKVVDELGFRNVNSNAFPSQYETPTSAPMAFVSKTTASRSSLTAKVGSSPFSTSRSIARWCRRSRSSWGRTCRRTGTWRDSLRARRRIGCNRSDGRQARSSDGDCATAARRGLSSFSRGRLCARPGDGARAGLTAAVQQRSCAPSD